MELVPLFKAKVDLAPSMAVGTGPRGDRSIGEIRAFEAEGERFKASLAGAAAADWLVRTGTTGVVDARLTLRTADGALVYMAYGGRLDLSNPAAGLYAMIAATFETGDERYAWLNKVQAVGKGRLSVRADGASIDYEIAELR